MANTLTSCTSCRHPFPFHPSQGPCRAFGCDCENFVGAAAPAPANLAEGIEQNYPGLVAALKDSGLGHKALAEKFPFTSESSVRRWRKKNEVSA